MKRWFLFLLIFVIILGILGSIFLIPHPTDQTVTFDGEPISFRSSPVRLMGQIFVPAEDLFGAMGSSFSFDEASKKITAYQNGTRLTMTLGSCWVDVNGKSKLWMTAPRMIHGIPFVAVRPAAEALGMTVVSQKKVISILPPTPTDVFSLEKSDQTQTFTNHYDGFSLTLPNDFSVDMSMPLVLSRFETDRFTLEVYREENIDHNIRNAYLNYTNQAITESVDLTVTANETVSIGDKKYQILAWNRPVLSRIEQDKNHYLKADFVDGTVVYTFLFKGTEPVHQLSTQILESFSLTPITCPLETAKEKTTKFHGQKRTRNAETQRYFEEVFGQDAPLTWGFFEPSYGQQWDTLPQTEEAVGHHFPILLLYSEFYDAYRPEVVGDYLKKAWDEGRVMELTLQPPGNADPHNFMYDVLDGKYDRFLTDYAQAVADFGHPVLFRPFNEANGDWCEYSAYQMSMDTELVRELTRYVGSFFDRAGADNVIFIFNPNGTSFPNFKWNDQRLYYPGDEYVDLWGITAYNTGNYYAGETWQDFDTLYQGLYQNTLEMTDMPLIITEFSCAREGGDKEAWVVDMQKKIENYPEIKVAIWWNHADFDGETVSRAYYFLDSEALVPIWKDYFNTLK